MKNVQNFQIINLQISFAALSNTTSSVKIGTRRQTTKMTCQIVTSAPLDAAHVQL